mmetsp:Transcript_66877/g.157604  ORF Transcript_66877/g.157604 Transcript_66877/m.157604 type:complete len:88 (-) Transcript_66877:1161-1424(-)
MGPVLEPTRHQFRNSEAAHPERHGTPTNLFSHSRQVQVFIGFVVSAYSAVSALLAAFLMSFDVRTCTAEVRAAQTPAAVPSQEARES